MLSDSAERRTPNYFRSRTAARIAMNWLDSAKRLRSIAASKAAECDSST